MDGQLEWIEHWVEKSPYGAALGIQLKELEAERVVLELPYHDSNSNGDRALHGGVAASMITTAAQALARRVLGQESGPWHTAAIQVAYLSAALGEPIEAEARLLRRGKELLNADVEVRSAEGKSVARGIVSVRGRFGDEPLKLPRARGDDGESDRGPMGPFMHRIPFHGKLGLSAEHMAGGRSRIVMPWRDSNADGSGGLHQGALLGLLDTTGAMAAWAETGPGRFKASTPGIQARVLTSPAAGDLIGFGRVLHRDRELLFSEVEIARADDGSLIAHGTVNYRIVTPDIAR